MTLRNFLRTFRLIASVCSSLSAMAQSDLPIHFTYTKSRVNDHEVLLSIKAIPSPGIRLFSIQKKSDDLPYSSVLFDSASNRYLNGATLEEGTKRTDNDPVFKQTLSYFTDSVDWTQKVNVASNDSVLLKGSVNYFYKKGDEYVPGEQPFRFFIQRAEAGLPDTASISLRGVTGQSLIWIFFAAFGGGLLALLTPCVYSMIPVTVSFFTKRSKTRSEGIRNAVLYATSIVLIFTFLGFLVTLIFGPAALNNLATNWVANLLFFVLFVVFGISFLGAFDITLPSSWTNRSDAKASTGSFWGIFFMALTLVLVSFSCTGPIIGNLLVLASRGNYMGPLIGMSGFSIALALPFALFAFFPSKLNVLGKAGGWLNAVKVSLGFFELALALKFLSNADLAKGWRLLDREIFISCWIVIFFLLGIYLLGKLKFHHDDELPKNDFGLPYLSVTRFLLATASLVFAVYMIPGLWGAPLKAISAFVPPMGTQDFIATGPRNTTKANFSSATGTALPHPVKYYEQMKLYEPEVVTTYGMVTYFDYDEALAVARNLKRPLMLDFTGINCVNCRKMEGQVWSNPEVMKRLKDSFVIASLYVDAQNVDLQENEQYESKALGRRIETLGDKNADLQVTKYGSNSQPYYFFLDGNGNLLAPDGYGYDPDTGKFTRMLDKVCEAYKKRS